MSANTGFVAKIKKLNIVYATAAVLTLCVGSSFFLGFGFLNKSSNTKSADLIDENQGVSPVYSAEVDYDEALAYMSSVSSHISKTIEIDEDAPVFSADDWKLILINKQNFIPEGYTFNLAGIYGGMSIDSRVAPYVNEMIDAARKDGHNLIVRSPWRSSDMQVMLFDAKIDYYMARGYSYIDAFQLGGQAVTIPGASEHEAGLSMDITSDTYAPLMADFSKVEAGKWLAENAHNYGFILRYPDDKEYITTIEFEPWHFRYVGVEAATIIYEEGITLEEFWEKYVE